MHNVSYWLNLSHLGELLGGLKACWKKWVAFYDGNGNYA